MRAVDFRNLVTGQKRPFRGSFVVIQQRGNLVHCQFMWLRPAFRHRHRRGADRRPGHVPTGKIRLVQRAVAVPGTLHSGLAPGMAELDSRYGAVSERELRHPCMAGDLAVGPDAGAAMGNPALFLHSSGFGEDDPCPADRKAPEMRQVPVIHMPLMRRILAHR